MENLDVQDRAICEDLHAGLTPEEVMQKYGVGQDKIDQLLPVVEKLYVGEETAQEENKTFGEALKVDTETLTPDTELIA